MEATARAITASANSSSSSSGSRVLCTVREVHVDPSALSSQSYTIGSVQHARQGKLSSASETYGSFLVSDESLLKPVLAMVDWNRRGELDWVHAPFCTQTLTQLTITNVR